MAKKPAVKKTLTGPAAVAELQRQVSRTDGIDGEED